MHTYIHIYIYIWWFRPWLHLRCAIVLHIFSNIMLRACNTCCIQNAIYILIAHGGNRMAGIVWREWHIDRTR
jgi:hypothetical protein